MSIPYVYLIGWKKLDTWYIGVRHAHDCHPSDLWKTYFTSCRKVKLFREANSEPDYFEILKEFEDPIVALAFEEEKQRELDVLNKPNWLNGNIGGKHFNRRGPLSEETKRKISETAKKRKRKPHSEETKRKIGLKHKGKTISEKQKQQISETLKAFVIPEETRIKISNANKGKVRSEEQRQRYSEAQKERYRKATLRALEPH